MSLKSNKIVHATISNKNIPALKQENESWRYVSYYDDQLEKAPEIARTELIRVMREDVNWRKRSIVPMGGKLVHPENKPPLSRRPLREETRKLSPLPAEPEGSEFAETNPRILQRLEELAKQKEKEKAKSRPVNRTKAPPRKVWAKMVKAGLPKHLQKPIGQKKINMTTDEFLAYNHGLAFLDWKRSILQNDAADELHAEIRELKKEYRNIKRDLSSAESKERSDLEKRLKDKEARLEKAVAKEKEKQVALYTREIEEIKVELSERLVLPSPEERKRAADLKKMITAKEKEEKKAIKDARKRFHDSENSFNASIARARYAQFNRDGYHDETVEKFLRVPKKMIATLPPPTIGHWPALPRGKLAGGTPMYFTWGLDQLNIVEDESEEGHYYEEEFPLEILKRKEWKKVPLSQIESPFKVSSEELKKLPHWNKPKYRRRKKKISMQADIGINAEKRKAYRMRTQRESFSILPTIEEVIKTPDPVCRMEEEYRPTRRTLREHALRRKRIRHLIRQGKYHVFNRAEARLTYMRQQVEKFRQAYYEARLTSREAREEANPDDMAGARGPPMPPPGRACSGLVEMDMSNHESICTVLEMIFRATDRVMSEVNLFHCLQLVNEKYDERDFIPSLQRSRYGAALICGDYHRNFSHGFLNMMRNANHLVLPTWLNTGGPETEVGCIAMVNGMYYVLAYGEFIFCRNEYQLLQALNHSEDPRIVPRFLPVTPAMFYETMKRLYMRGNTFDRSLSRFRRYTRREYWWVPGDDDIYSANSDLSSDYADVADMESDEIYERYEAQRPVVDTVAEWSGTAAKVVSLVLLLKDCKTIKEFMVKASSAAILLTPDHLIRDAVKALQGLFSTRETERESLEEVSELITQVRTWTALTGQAKTLLTKTCTVMSLLSIWSKFELTTEDFGGLIDSVQLQTLTTKQTWFDITDAALHILDYVVNAAIAWKSGKKLIRCLNPCSVADRLSDLKAIEPKVLDGTLGPKDPFTRETYYQEVCSVLTALSTMKNDPREDERNKLFYRKQYEEAAHMKHEVEKAFRAFKPRMAPFATAIYGDTGVAKSTIVDVLSSIGGHVLNMGAGDANKYTFNDKKKYDDGYTNDTNIVIYDDVGNTNEKHCEMHPMAYAIQDVNNMPVLTNQAEAHKKSTIFMNHKLTFATSNKINFDIPLVSDAPASVSRRFNFVEVRAFGGKFDVDEAQSPANHLTMQWEVRTYDFESKEVTSKHMHRKVGEWMLLTDYIQNVWTPSLKRHVEIQKKYMKSNQDLATESPCEHGTLPHWCLTCKPENIINYSRKLRSGEGVLTQEPPKTANGRTFVADEDNPELEKLAFISKISRTKVDPTAFICQPAAADPPVVREMFENVSVPNVPMMMTEGLVRKVHELSGTRIRTSGSMSRGERFMFSTFFLSEYAQVYLAGVVLIGFLSCYLNKVFYGAFVVSSMIGLVHLARAMLKVARRVILNRVLQAALDPQKIENVIRYGAIAIGSFAAAYLAWRKFYSFWKETKMLRESLLRPLYGDDDLEKRNKAKSQWARAVDMRSDFDHDDKMDSLTPEQAQGQIANRLFSVKQDDRIKTNGFAVAARVLLVNKHFARKIDLDRPLQLLNGVAGTTTRDKDLRVEKIIHHDVKDFSLLCLSAPLGVRTRIDMILQGNYDKSVDHPCRMLTRDVDTGITQTRFLEWHYEECPNLDLEAPDVPGSVHWLDLPTKPGDCGSPIYTVSRPHVILGFHTGKRGEAAVGETVMLSEFTIPEEYHSHIGRISAPGVVKDPEMFVTAPHERSVIRYITEDAKSTLRYYGTTGIRTTPSSDFVVTKLSPILDTVGLQRTHEVPLMKTQRSLANYLQVYMEGSMDEIPPELLKKCVKEFASHWGEGLRAAGLKATGFDTIEVAIDGMDDRFANRTDLSTAGGFGWPGKKANYAEVVSQPQEKRIAIPSEDWKAATLEYIEMIRSGEMPTFVTRTSLKDEPVAIGKEKKLPRIFSVLPMHVNLALKMALGPIMRADMKIPIDNGCAAGINICSREGGEMYRELFAAGVAEKDGYYHILPQEELNILEGDYSKFDVRTSGQLIHAAADLNYLKAIMLGYSYEDADAVRRMIQNHAFTLKDANGDLIAVVGWLDSGSYVTLKLNSEVNVLLHMCAYYDAFPKEKETFYENVSLMTQGDDSMGCSNGKFTMRHMADFCTKYNMKYTDGNKEPVVHEFSTKQLTFCKRTFRVDEETHHMMTPLDMTAIMKPFHFVKKGIPETLHFINLLKPTWLELAQHGRGIFNEYQAKLKSAFSMVPAVTFDDEETSDKPHTHTLYEELEKHFMSYDDTIADLAHVYEGAPKFRYVSSGKPDVTFLEKPLSIGLTPAFPLLTEREAFNAEQGRPSPAQPCQQPERERHNSNYEEQHFLDYTVEPQETALHASGDSLMQHGQTSMDNTSVLMREQRLYTTELLPGQTIFQELNPAEILNDPIVLNRTAKFAYMRTGFRIRVMVTGNPVLSGRLSLTYSPLPDTDNFTFFRESVPQDLIAASQRYCIYLDARASDGGTLEVDYLYPTPWLRVVDREWMKLGKLTLRSETALQSVTDSQTPLRITIFVQPVNLELSKPTSRVGDLTERQSWTGANPSTGKGSHLQSLGFTEASVPSGVVDESAMTNLVNQATKESFLTTLPWGEGMAPDTCIQSFLPSPYMWDTYDGEDGLEIHMTPACHASLPFGKWRGTVLFRFDVVASERHRGVFRIMWDPLGMTETSLGRFNEVPSMICDISESRTFEFAVPWGHWKNWLDGHDGNWDVPFSSTPITDIRRFANGVLNLVVVNPLNSQSDSLKPATIFVHCKMLKDFEVVDPLPRPLLQIQEKNSNEGTDDDQNVPADLDPNPQDPPTPPDPQPDFSSPQYQDIPRAAISKGPIGFGLPYAGETNGISINTGTTVSLRVIPESWYQVSGTGQSTVAIPYSLTDTASGYRVTQNFAGQIIDIPLQSGNQSTLKGFTLINQSNNGATWQLTNLKCRRPGAINTSGYITVPLTGTDTSRGFETKLYDIGTTLTLGDRVPGTPVVIAFTGGTVTCGSSQTQNSNPLIRHQFSGSPTVTITAGVRIGYIGYWYDTALSSRTVREAADEDNTETPMAEETTTTHEIQAKTPTALKPMYGERVMNVHKFLQRYVTSYALSRSSDGTTSVILPMYPNQAIASSTVTVTNHLSSYYEYFTSPFLTVKGSMHVKVLRSPGSYALQHKTISIERLPVNRNIIAADFDIKDYPTMNFSGATVDNALLTAGLETTIPHYSDYFFFYNRASRYRGVDTDHVPQSVLLRTFQEATEKFEIAYAIGDDYVLGHYLSVPIFRTL
ncbi:putative polyprotein [Freshwater macrophyte associated picorna-like virus 3]|nr:putative polyprotein [Freshwater macrophyte associated picorna-like virus 3]